MTTKFDVFYNNKDKTYFSNNSFVVYQFSCPGCCASYVSKTERTLDESCTEHSWFNKGSAVRTRIDE